MTKELEARTTTSLREEVARVMVAAYDKHMPDGLRSDRETYPADLDAADAAIAIVLERAAGVIQRRIDERFEEHGTREWDTNACYYTGANADIYEALDEEGEELTAAIRKLGETQ